MMDNIESLTTAMTVNIWLAVIWKVILITLLIMIIGIAVCTFIHDITH